MRCNNAVQKSPVAWEAFELGKRAGLFFASYYVAIEALKGQRAAKGQAQPTQRIGHGGQHSMGAEGSWRRLIADGRPATEPGAFDAVYNFE